MRSVSSAANPFVTGPVRFKVDTPNPSFSKSNGAVTFLRVEAEKPAFGIVLVGLDRHWLSMTGIESLGIANGVDFEASRGLPPI
jgi:hypothetical protein